MKWIRRHKNGDRLCGVNPRGQNRRVGKRTPEIGVRAESQWACVQPGGWIGIAAQSAMRRRGGNSCLPSNRIGHRRTALAARMRPFRLFIAVPGNCVRLEVFPWAERSIRALPGGARGSRHQEQREAQQPCDPSSISVVARHTCGSVRSVSDAMCYGMPDYRIFRRDTRPLNGGFWTGRVT